MENIGAIIGVGSATFGLVQSVTGLDEKMQILRRKIEILISREADLTAEIEYAESGLGNKRKREVDTWMAHLHRLKDEVQSLESQVEEKGLIAGVKLVNRANLLIKEADELEMRGKFPGGPSQMVEDDFGYEIPTVELVGNAFREYFNEILSCLTNDEVSSIGVYGMGGVGKTTLATNIHNHLLKTQTYAVCWVTVSQECKIETLQDRIAKRLNLDLSNDDGITRRAAKLFHILAKKKPIIILDDVWSFFNMKEVGIPMGSSGCRLILTTRSWNICRQMECQQVIEVKTLSENEGWHLFMRNLGPRVVFPPDVEQIARSVAKECAGLPLGIVVVSGSMRGIEDIYQWRNALEELKNANQEFMVEKVFGVLKFSYTRLSDPTLRRCFLYVASYPEDMQIRRKDLVKFFVNTGLIDRMSNRRAELDRAHSIVTKLVNVCLLESTQGQEINAPREIVDYFKMHDLIRDMVINMTGSHFMMKAGLSLREVPEESEWTESLETVSLMYNFSIVEIPTKMSPKCPRLSMLSLSNTRLAKVGDSFFHFMPSLQVLDLSYTLVEILPNSISNLEKLIALVLRSCYRLSSLPSLAKLKALKTLDLSKSGLRKAPEGVESLVNLKFLDVGGSRLGKLPPEVLPQMSQLQYLCLNSRCQVLNVKASELIRLRKLETLKCTFLNSHEFNEYARYLQYQGPTYWDLRLGYHKLDHDDDLGDYSKVVRLYGYQRAKGRVESLLLPKDTDALYVESAGVVDLRTLVDLPSLESMSNLKLCKVHDSESLEDVVRLCPSSLSLSSHNSVRTLEVIELSHLRNLRSLIQAKDDGAIIPRVLSDSNIFCHLKVIKISYCHKMKKLLVYVLLPVLVNVEELDVAYCHGIEELFPVTEGGNEATKVGEAVSPMVSRLPKLKRLRLFGLPALRSICTRTIVCDSAQELLLQECRKLEKIPLHLRIPHTGEFSNKTSPMRIEIWEEELDWWRSLEFAHPDDKILLQQHIHIDHRYRLT